MPHVLDHRPVGHGVDLGGPLSEAEKQQAAHLLY
jgi:hypothetical protein